MSLESLAACAAESFAAAYGRAPRWLAAAPGRVNLIGEHTDYNDGFVLPMAIERATVILAAPNEQRRITLRSATTKGQAVIDLRKPIERGAPAWSNYVRGVIAGFQRLGVSLNGFDALIDSDVPLGGGLSSSAALEVATATLLEALTGRVLDPVEKALLCQRAEHEFAGVPCGIMDQFTSVMAKEGHLLLLDCRSRTTELVPMRDALVAVLIINTNVHHELANGEYAQRRAQCEAAARALRVPSLRDSTLAGLQAARGNMEPVEFRRARHVITEIERTQQAARAIRAGDWRATGDLMYASHASLRDDFEVSCAELDLVVEMAQSIGEIGGVIGCRMTGGGFGGCAVSLVRAAVIPQITQQIADRYRKKAGLEPAIFSSRPAGGARALV
jgi:galactokinase